MLSLDELLDLVRRQENIAQLGDIAIGWRAYIADRDERVLEARKLLAVLRLASI